MREFENVANLLKIKRQENNKKYSQSELSRLLGYKNGQFISNIERGLCSIPLKNLKQVTQILTIDHDELLGALMKDYEVTLNHYLDLDPEKQKVGTRRNHLPESASDSR